MLPAMDIDDLNDAMAESNRRARRGRTIARLLFGGTVGLIAFALLFFFVIAPPMCMCPMFPNPPGLFGIPRDLIIGIAGTVGTAAGLFWMWRIVRTEPDPESWSVRRRRARGSKLPAMDIDALNDAMAESNRRARRGRTIARLMFVAAVGLTVVAVFLFIAQPGFMGGPMFGHPPGLFGLSYDLIIGVAACVGTATGLFWMWHIVRNEPDPDPWSLRRLYQR